MNNGWKKYNKNEILTSHPVKLTIMAYEKCILNLNIIKTKITEMKYREADERIENTERIINELFMQVDPHAFPELADDFYKLYTWLYEQLTEIKRKRDPKMVDGMIPVLQNLASGFKEAIEKNG